MVGSDQITVAVETDETFGLEGFHQEKDIMEFTCKRKISHTRLVVGRWLGAVAVMELVEREHIMSIVWNGVDSRTYGGKSYGLKGKENLG